MNFTGGITNVNRLSQSLINLYTPGFEVAVDCTLGNGHYTDFLSVIFKKVYAFDIQKKAVDRYIEKNIKNVFAVCDSHNKIDEYIVGKVGCIVYNLGYLPGSDKKVATNARTTIESIKKGLFLLKLGGIM
jgi:hypothetical protein